MGGPSHLWVDSDLYTQDISYRLKSVLEKLMKCLGIGCNGNFGSSINFDRVALVNSFST